MKVACLVVALSLALAISLPHAAEDTRDLTGIYEGELNSASHTLRITATLVQTRDQVAGLWSTSSGSGSGRNDGYCLRWCNLGLGRCSDGPMPGFAQGLGDHQRSRGHPRRALYDHELSGYERG